MKLVLVWGPPGAGKTTFVRQNVCRDTDLVLDIDHLASALNLSGTHDASKQAWKTACDVYDFVLKSEKADVDRLWVIDCAARCERREWYQVFAETRGWEFEAFLVQGQQALCKDRIREEPIHALRKLERLSACEKWFDSKT